MASANLHRLGDDLLAEAGSVSAGRAARTIVGGADAPLRQTLLALRAGSELAEHGSPGPATLLVLRGRVELRAGEDTWPLAAGDHLPLPDRRHSLAAASDALVLLTVAPR